MVPGLERAQSNLHQEDFEMLSATLEAFHGQRYRWRVALMAEWLASGRTITEFAEAHGVSRQYASRIAREVQNQTT